MRTVCWRPRAGETRPRSPACSSPTSASSTPTATGCSARSSTPTTRCRTPSCAPGRRSSASRAAARCARWLYTIATNTCLTQIQRRPKRVLPVDYGPATDPLDRPGPADHRDGLDRALPGHRARGRPRRPRGALRAARERRARLHRRAPAPAGHAARGPDPARGPRLLGQGGRGDASRRPSPRSTARSSAPAPRSRSASATQSSRRRCARSATTRSRRSSRPTSTPGSATTSRPSSRCSPRTRRSACRRWRAGSARATSSRSSCASTRCPARSAGRCVITTANGQPAFGAYAWDADRAGLHGLRAQRAHVPRRQDLRRRRVRGQGDRRAARGGLPPLGHEPGPTRPGCGTRSQRFGLPDRI